MQKQQQSPTTSRPLIPSTVTFFDGELSMLPGVRIPLRSMLVETGAEPILISPVGTPEERLAIADRRVTLVEPSLLHHKRLARPLAELDVADLWAPPGFEKKQPELAPTKTLGEDRWPYAMLPFVIVEGAPKRNEVVFFHQPSRTIYTADLVFNIRRSAGWLSPLTFRAMGIYHRFAVARMWKHWVEDQAAFRASIDKILAWDFDRIAMAHGEVIERDGRARLIEALRERDLY